MDSLVHKIERLRLRYKNHEGRHFLPETPLHDLMTESAVRATLQSLATQSYHLEELVKDILSGGWKVFAILLLIGQADAITLFFKHKFPQIAYVDHRLPYSKEMLEEIFEDRADDLAISKFLEIQWGIAIQFFSSRLLPRKLASETILPFVTEDCLGPGGLGTVWKTELDSACHSLPIVSNKVCWPLSFPLLGD